MKAPHPYMTLCMQAQHAGSPHMSFLSHQAPTGSAPGYWLAPGYITDTQKPTPATSLTRVSALVNCVATALTSAGMALTPLTRSTTLFFSSATAGARVCVFVSCCAVV